VVHSLGLGSLGGGRGVQFHLEGRGVQFMDTLDDTLFIINIIIILS